MSFFYNNNLTKLSSDELIAVVLVVTTRARHEEDDSVNSPVSVSRSQAIYRYIHIWGKVGGAVGFQPAKSR